MDDVQQTNVAAKVQQLRTLIQSQIQEDPEIAAWCTDACLQRFLMARRLDVAKSQIMIKATMAWRSTYRPHHIRWEDVQHEAKTGKTFISDIPDKEGRTIVMMRPRNENTKEVDSQIRFVVYNLELASRRADRLGIAKMTWLVDFEGYSMKNAPPPKVGVQTLNILQSHYPERLGLAICYHPPWLFQIMYKAVSPFIDPVTHKKIFFCDKGAKGDATMARFFDMDQMDECLGGRGPPQFHFARYEAQQLADRAAVDDIK